MLCPKDNKDNNKNKNKNKDFAPSCFSSTAPFLNLPATFSPGGNLTLQAFGAFWGLKSKVISRNVMRSWEKKEKKNISLLES